MISPTPEWTEEVQVMLLHWCQKYTLTHIPDSKVHGANMGPSRADRTQMGPMLSPWTLLSRIILNIPTCRYDETGINAFHFIPIVITVHPVQTWNNLVTKYIPIKIYLCSEIITPFNVFYSINWKQSLCRDEKLAGILQARIASQLILQVLIGHVARNLCLNCHNRNSLYFLPKCTYLSCASFAEGVNGHAWTVAVKCWVSSLVWFPFQKVLKC